MAAYMEGEGDTPGLTDTKEKISIVERDGFPSNNVDNEKGNVPHVVHHIVSKDGIVLHPQPTADALDPLNWSSWKKHTILAIVMYL